MKKEKQPVWAFIGCGLIVLFWIVLGTIEIVQYFQRKSAQTPFKSIAGQYQAVCKTCFSQVSEFPKLLDFQVDNYDYYLPYSPYVHDKVLVVEAVTGEAIGKTMLELSPDIAAKNPDEVTTLVCAGEKMKLEYGTYTDKSKAYWYRRDFCIYDIPARKVILAAKINGTSPPTFKQSSESGTGSDPAYNPLIKILEGCPKK
jgi:hypothetical protein